ncbi:MAG: glycine--tRNA ligase subunit alpha [Candidatus Omnitrophica bacterium]|nr:glycine--tRNA ligase subunit alpha [Candidatus Omnitrophota bacterium]
MEFQKIVRKLEDYWIKKGCFWWHPYNTEVGAGTLNPATFFGILGKKNWNVVYLEPSQRPQDARYGDNPVRLYQHHQLQVILKPPSDNIQNIYLESFKSIGIDIRKHDLRFIEDNWEAPTLGAWGVGWEVWLDGLEITQFTYMQQAGGVDLNPVAVEITYGLDRITSFLQNKSSVFDIDWGSGMSFETLQKERERQYSIFGFEKANVAILEICLEKFENEADALLKENLFYPAYDYVLKLSHIFNLLEARGFITVTERTRIIGKIRSLANKCARLYLKSQGEV